MTIGLSSCAKRNTAYQDDEWLTLERQLPIVGNPLDIKIDNSYIYVAQDQGGISVIRRSDYLQNWVTRMIAADGSETNLGRIKRISVVPEQNRMFFNEVAAHDRIVIVDTTDPDTLKYVMEITGGTGGIKDLDSFPIPNPSGIFTMEIGYCSAGSFRYDRYDGTILNVNNFAVTPLGAASGFALSNDYIFVSAEQCGLYIYNRSNQQLVSSIVLPGEAQRVVVSGNLAFVASRQAGLHIVSIANPAAPVLLSSFETSGYANALDVSGTKVAVSSTSGGIYLFDIANPNSPILLQHLTSCGYTNSVKFMGDKLVVGARDQGVLVYKVK
jgi:hypothetical protein